MLLPIQFWAKTLAALRVHSRDQRSRRRGSVVGRGSHDPTPRPRKLMVEQLEPLTMLTGITVAADAPSYIEGQTAWFTFTLDQPAPQAFQVDLLLSGGPAGPTGYVMPISQGQTSAHVDFPTSENSTPGDGYTLSVQITGSSESGPSGPFGGASLEILDNDGSGPSGPSCCTGCTGSTSAAASVAEGASIGTLIYTVVPPGMGPYTYAIGGGNSVGYFAIDGSGNVTVNDIILVDTDQLHSLEIVATAPCGDYTVDLDVTVLPVFIEVYPAEEGDSFSFQFDHYDGAIASVDTYWILPAPYIIDVTLPDVASPSDYEVELWNGSILQLTSTEQSFQIDVVPQVTDGTIDVRAEVVLAADPTVQVAEDNKPSEFGQWQKKIEDQVETWVGDLAQSGFKSVLKDKIKDPFNSAKTAVNDTIGQLDPVDDAVAIQTLTTFRDTQLPALHDQMVGKVTDLVFDQFLHTGKATVRNGSAARQGLDQLNGVDTSNATKNFEIDPVVKFQLSDETKAALLQGNIGPLKNDLEKPYKLFSEVGAGVKYSFDTESYLTGRLTVSNLDSDLKKSTYTGSLNYFNVEAGGKRITFGLSQKYTPETDSHQSGLSLTIER